MSEMEIPAVLARQEEYLKRREYCRKVRFRQHRFVRSVADPWSVCDVCGVTETDEDYAKKEN